MSKPVSKKAERRLAPQRAFPRGVSYATLHFDEGLPVLKAPDNPLLPAIGMQERVEMRNAVSGQFHRELGAHSDSILVAFPDGLNVRERAAQLAKCLRGDALEYSTPGVEIRSVLLFDEEVFTSYYGAKVETSGDDAPSTKVVKVARVEDFIPVGLESTLSSALKAVIRGLSPERLVFLCQALPEQRGENDYTQADTIEHVNAMLSQAVFVYRLLSESAGIPPQPDAAVQLALTEVLCAATRNQKNQLPPLKETVFALLRPDGDELIVDEPVKGLSPLPGEYRERMQRHIDSQRDFERSTFAFVVNEILALRPGCDMLLRIDPDKYFLDIFGVAFALVHELLDERFTSHSWSDGGEPFSLGKLVTIGLVSDIVGSEFCNIDEEVVAPEPAPPSGGDDQQLVDDKGPGASPGGGASATSDSLADALPDFATGAFAALREDAAVHSEEAARLASQLLGFEKARLEEVQDELLKLEGLDFHRQSPKDSIALKREFAARLSQVVRDLGYAFVCPSARCGQLAGTLRVTAKGHGQFQFRHSTGSQQGKNHGGGSVVPRLVIAPSRGEPK